MEQTCYDSTRLDQVQHEENLFQITTDFLDRFSAGSSVPVRNYCINSKNLGVVYSDYFADAQFSRG